MNTYQAFYNIMRLGLPVDASAPATVRADEVNNDIFPLIKEDQEFLGLVDRAETTLQMMYYADTNDFWIEIPRPDLEGAFGMRLSNDDTRILLRALPQAFPLEGFDGFEFGAWRT